MGHVTAQLVTDLADVGRAEVRRLRQSRAVVRTVLNDAGRNDITRSVEATSGVVESGLIDQRVVAGTCLADDRIVLRTELLDVREVVGSVLRNGKALQFGNPIGCALYGDAFIVASGLGDAGHAFLALLGEIGPVTDGAGCVLADGGLVVLATLVDERSIVVAGLRRGGRKAGRLCRTELVDFGNIRIAGLVDQRIAATGARAATDFLADLSSVEVAELVDIAVRIGCGILVDAREVRCAVLGHASMDVAIIERLADAVAVAVLIDVGFVEIAGLIDIGLLCATVLDHARKAGAVLVDIRLVAASFGVGGAKLGNLRDSAIPALFHFGAVCAIRIFAIARLVDGRLCIRSALQDHGFVELVGLIDVRDVV